MVVCSNNWTRGTLLFNLHRVLLVQSPRQRRPTSISFNQFSFIAKLHNGNLLRFSFFIFYAVIAIWNYIGD